MAEYIDIRFPVDISINASGQIHFNNENSIVNDGHIQSVGFWDQALRDYDASYGVKTFGDLEVAVAFWEVVGGPEKEFKFRDPFDYDTAGWSVQDKVAITSTQQFIGTGDSTATQFQLRKTYAIAGTTLSMNRLITHPVSTSFIVELAGTTQSSTAYTLDDLTGIITFGTPPGAVAIRAGFEFDLVCQFKTERIPVDLENYHLGTARLELIEVRSTSTVGL